MSIPRWSQATIAIDEKNSTAGKNETSLWLIDAILGFWINLSVSFDELLAAAFRFWNTLAVPGTYVGGLMEATVE